MRSVRRGEKESTRRRCGGRAIPLRRSRVLESATTSQKVASPSSCLANLRETRMRDLPAKGCGRMFLLRFRTPKQPRPFAIGDRSHFGLGLFVPFGPRRFRLIR